MKWKSETERVAAWKNKNKDKVKAQDHRRYLKHKKEIYERTREWKKNNPEKVREYQQEWILTRPEYYREYSKKLKNKENYKDSI